MKPIYSICMCNYNMADTLERSLTSILDQLDERFEVVVADDGSSDNSVAVIETLQKIYPILRLVKLKRDSKRKLGLTRNISIQEARGDYVLLHLDCDDIYDPYLIDFTKAFHQIEEAIGHDILLSGQHVNMGKRTFLLEHGPYRNIFRGEDRDLWGRLAKINAYIPFDHINFVTRIPKTRTQRYKRSFVNTWDHLQNDFRSGSSLKSFLYYETRRGREMSLKSRILRLLLCGPAYLAAKSKEPISRDNAIGKPEIFAEYREKTRGKLSEILKRYDRQPNYEQLSAGAKQIFT